MFVLLSRLALMEEIVVPEVAPEVASEAPIEIPDLQTEEIIEPPKISKGASFYGSAFVNFNSKPLTSENNTANASLVFGFDGAARNAVETFARISDEKNKFFTLVGNDSLGQVLKADLIKNKVNVNNVEIDPKSPTASKIVLNVEKSTLASILSESEEEKKQDKQNLTQIVQYNHDILHKVAYKYLYPRFRDVNDSEYIYADMMVNENSIKALINNFGSKLYLQTVEPENLAKYVSIMKAYAQELANNKKKVDSKYLVQTLYISLREAGAIPKFFCDNLKDQKLFKDVCKLVEKLDAAKLLVDDYVAQRKKFSYSEYLLKNEETVAEIFSALHLLTKAKTLFVRIPGSSAVIVSVDGEEIAYSESSCNGKCIVAENGSDEAFLAGFLQAKLQNKRLDDCLEMAHFVMISAMQTENPVNDKLDGALVKKISASNFVSYKPIHVYGDNEEVKTEV